MLIYYNITEYDAVELVTFQPETEVKQWQSDVIMAVIQWIIFVVGTAGNLLVLIVLLWRRPPKYKVTQLLVGVLSVANIGTMTSSAWVQGLLYVDSRWPFDLIGCKVHFALQAMTPYLSMWTLATLAVDRYFGMTKPPGESFVPVIAAACIVITTWTLIVAINLPLLLWSGIIYDSNYNAVGCALITGSNGNSRPRRLLAQVSPGVTAIVVGGLPEQQRIVRRRVTAMCVSIAVSFTVTTLPYQTVIYVITFVGKQSVAVNLLNPLRTVAMLNACLHPIIFGLMWRPFQQSLLQEGTEDVRSPTKDVECLGISLARASRLFYLQRE